MSNIIPTGINFYDDKNFNIIKENFAFNLKLVNFIAFVFSACEVCIDAFDLEWRTY